ncbi:epimerase [Paenibacillus sp. NPDC058071]|uniref:epimerase n=1 Tax=Paenibacillus sp. NPDC058071 TaxID=3346326 RepID=UPI0036D87774
MKNGLEAFGEILMTQVRDKAIFHWEKVLHGEMKDKGSKLLFEEFINNLEKDQQERIVDITSQVVDTTLHFLLLALEEESLISVFAKYDDGEPIDIKKLSDGLPGELYTEDGWIMKFSDKRYLQP